MEKLTLRQLLPTIKLNGMVTIEIMTKTHDTEIYMHVDEIEKILSNDVINGDVSMISTGLKDSIKLLVRIED